MLTHAFYAFGGPWSWLTGRAMTFLNYCQVTFKTKCIMTGRKPFLSSLPSLSVRATASPFSTVRQIEKCNFSLDRKRQAKVGQISFSKCRKNIKYGHECAHLPGPLLEFTIRQWFRTTLHPQGLSLKYELCISFAIQNKFWRDVNNSTIYLCGG